MEPMLKSFCFTEEKKKRKKKELLVLLVVEADGKCKSHKSDSQRENSNNSVVNIYIINLFIEIS